MSASPASSGSNPRKFSEKIALHNQKQAEETRAFDELMTDLTMSRVQFQRLQQIRLAQSRAQFYGGSLPNVNQISSSPNDFQPTFHHTDNIRGMRRHGLVERVSLNRLHSPHHRPIEKHGRQISFQVEDEGKRKLSPGMLQMLVVLFFLCNSNLPASTWRYWTTSSGSSQIAYPCNPQTEIWDARKPRKAMYEFLAVLSAV